MKNEEKRVLTETLTQERLFELLDYFPETGAWIWKVTVSTRTRAGSVAGYVRKADGYRMIGIDGVLHKSSRLAFLHMTGSCPKEVDHKNRVRVDDKWKNLREMTHQGNNRNRGTQSNNSSGITGVCFHEQSGKWRARIKINGKDICLGYYEEFHDAACARYSAELQYSWQESNPNTTAKQYIDNHFERTKSKLGKINEQGRY